MPTATAVGTATPLRSGSDASPAPRTRPTPSTASVHLWYDADNKDNFTAYKLLIADVVNDRLVAVPRGVMAAAGIMQGARGGIDGVSSRERTRIKNHLAKYYKKMDDTPPWED